MTHDVGIADPYCNGFYFIIFKLKGESGAAKTRNAPSLSAMEARNERADSPWKPPVPDVFSQKKYKAHERGVESFVVGVARSGNSGRRTARAAEGNICDQFLAPEGDLDVPSGFAKNGNTLIDPLDDSFVSIPLFV